MEPDTPATEPTDVVESTDDAAVATEAAQPTDDAAAATEDVAEEAEAAEAAPAGDAAPAVVAAGPTDLESLDDIALADRMKAGREQILSELHKKIIGQNEIIEQAPPLADIVSLNSSTQSMEEMVNRIVEKVKVINDN